MKIPKVAVTAEEKRLKGLNYAVKNRGGWANHLRAKCGAQTLNEFEKAGLVTTASKPNGFETYKITKLGNDTYKKDYGAKNYYLARIVGIFERISGKI